MIRNQYERLLVVAAFRHLVELLSKDAGAKEAI